ncbi:hypothetical protein K0M31_003019 [Melipona bicolor]|uniref:Uncharacterized protein n=1 Tax=Melipona bicolor TaxID=60889 RepID=A0AA40G046_9HYME|nr:hypothetical protein K0M31_003019 [Melipona bicolor]
MARKFSLEGVHQQFELLSVRNPTWLWPTYASAHNNLGTLTVGDQAEQHFLAAIHAQPGHVNAHYNLGQLYRSVDNRFHFVEEMPGEDGDTWDQN